MRIRIHRGLEVPRTFPTYVNMSRSCFYIMYPAKEYAGKAPVRLRFSLIKGKESMVRLIYAIGSRWATSVGMIEHEHTVFEAMETACREYDNAKEYYEGVYTDYGSRGNSD